MVVFHNTSAPHMVLTVPGTTLKVSSLMAYIWDCGHDEIATGFPGGL